MKRWILILVAVVACGSDMDESALMIENEVRGDTVVVISSGVVGVDALESVEILWQDGTLGDPTSMAVVGDHLVIGDADRVHVVPRFGGEVRSFGRAGEGPGEFRRIVGVAGFGQDTIATYDVGLGRLSLFSVEGGFLESHQIARPYPFVNPYQGLRNLRGATVVRSGSGFLSLWLENLRSDRPRQVALAWHDLDADSWRALGTWDDAQVEDVTDDGGVVGFRDLYPARAIVVLGRDGQVAEGNGLDYCIRTRDAFGEGIRMACRERRPVPVGDGIRSPDLSLIAGDDRYEIAELTIEFQNVGDVLPHFDQLMYAESGDLWVRILHQEMAEVHPSIARRRWDMGPERRLWEVFDAEGRLVRSVSVPAAFDPRVVLDGRLYGFFTLATGEVTIGVGSL